MAGDESRDQLGDGPIGTFILRLRLGPDQPLIGSIGMVGETVHVPFRGWMDFMSTVDRLRASPGPGASEE